MALDNLHSFDIAGRNQLVDTALRDAYGPQYRSDPLGQRWSSWAGADEMTGGGGGDFAGIAPYNSGSSGRTSSSGAGARGPVNMGSGQDSGDDWFERNFYGHNGGAGYNVAQSVNSREPSKGLATFMDNIASRPDPSFGALPDLKFDEFEMPEIDERKVALLTEQAGAADRQDIRQSMLARVMSEARHIQNPTQRKNFIREALKGYGLSLSKIQQAAGREGRQSYMNMYYNPMVQERQTNFQADINRRLANYNAQLNKLAAEYNFAGSQSLAGDQMLANYYYNYDVGAARPKAPSIHQDRLDAWRSKFA